MDLEIKKLQSKIINYLLNLFNHKYIYLFCIYDYFMYSFYEKLGFKYYGKLEDSKDIETHWLEKKPDSKYLTI